MLRAMSPSLATRLVDLGLSPALGLDVCETPADSGFARAQ